MSDKNNELLRIWTDDYFNRNLTELEKRLSDWWLSEGFFYVSNFTETDNGTRAELMLLIGNSVNNLIFENNLIIPYERQCKVEIKLTNRAGFL